jgi:site-specific recombinase XerD
MTSLAPTLQAFFTDRLIRERHASPNTVAAYRDSFRLLLRYAQDQTGKEPSQLDLTDLDAMLVSAFLDHLERQRGNGVRTRNARLAAVHSLFRFAALRHPEHASLIQRVLAIPEKRGDHALIAFLTEAEIEELLQSPDRTRWIGRRDHALLVVAIQTGLRVSELTGLGCADIELCSGPHLRCRGKGRKERATPLTTQTVAVLRAWLDELHGAPADPVFPTSRGAPLSRDAVGRLVARHATAAHDTCPSLRNKNVTPHVLRHTCAMQLLHAGVDTSVIALWLGHESIKTTQIYLHADLALKERALSRTTPSDVAPGRYKPPDTVLAFLESL